MISYEPDPPVPESDLPRTLTVDELYTEFEDEDDAVPILVENPDGQKFTLQNVVRFENSVDGVRCAILTLGETLPHQ